MNIEDRQLDEWLRDVDIPSDLSERLLALPSSGAKVERSPKHRLTIAAAIFAVAASIVGVIVMVRWSKNTTQPTIVAKNSNESTGSFGINEAQPFPIAKAAADPIQNIRAGTDFIDNMIREIAIRDLSERLAATSNALRLKSLDSDQCASLIVSLSDQSALQLGAERLWVERDMARVIQRFPNTSGAKLAEQFIAQESIQ